MKSQRKKDEQDAKNSAISIEDFLEVERHKLDPTKLTPVTPESFAIWKKTRLDKKVAEAEAVRKAKEQAASAGKGTGMSGRDLFVHLLTLDSLSILLVYTKTKKKEKKRTIGILMLTGNEQKRNLPNPKRRGWLDWECRIFRFRVVNHQIHS